MTEAPAYDYQICGWRLRSEIAFPELSAWVGNDRPPDLTFGFVATGDLPLPIDTDAVGGMDSEGAFRFTVPGVAQVAARRGKQVSVALMEGIADRAVVRPYLLGSALGVLCFQRGLLPLHAACVVLHGQAVIVTGGSGAGKSTLTAALLQQGALFLSEDLCPVSCADDGDAVPLVLPSVPRVKLAPDALEHFGLNATRGQRAAGPLEKYVVTTAGVAATGPVPLGAIYHIDEGDAERPTLTPLRGLEALEALRRSVYLWEVTRPMGLSETAFRAVAHLAASVPSRRLRRAARLEGVDEMARWIIEDSAA